MAVPILKTAHARKIAIVCGAPSSQHLVPHEDAEWEVWVLGNRVDNYKGKRITRVFEIHDDLRQHPAEYPGYLASLNIPLVVGEGFPVKADHIQTFPFSSANVLFGSEYLTSSTAYMVALALLEGATHIGIYGSDMSVDDHEYFWQRPCLEAWIGFAKGRGVNVHIPEVSPIGKCEYVEGRQSGGKPQFAKPPFTEAGFMEMALAHARKIEELRRQIEALQVHINTHDGSRQSYERLAKVARAVESGQTISSLMDTARLK